MADKTGNIGIRVFVYGTLKQGHGNNRVLDGAKLLGRALIEGPYRLLDLGWYPAVVHDPHGSSRSIMGEVYLISDEQLRACDMIEGHPNYYERVKVDTKFKSAWVYCLPSAYIGKFPEIKDFGWQLNKSDEEWLNNELAQQ